MTAAPARAWLTRRPGAAGHAGRRRRPGASLVAFLAALAAVDLALVAIALLHSDATAGALLALPVAIVATAFRGLRTRARPHERLELLHESIEAMRGRPEHASAVSRLMTAVRQLVRADYAEILLFATDTERGLRSTVRSRGELATRADAIGPDDEQVLIALRERGETLLLSAPRPLHPLDGYLAARNVPDAMITTLSGEAGPFGLLIVGERRAGVASFDQDDRRALDTFVAHASVVLELGRLERSLAEVTGLKERLGHQALHDVLTGLPNRALLTDRVEAAIAAGATSAAVLFLDLDDFKLVNDTLGHSIGDEVLAEVAVRIKQAVRPGDTAARLGGDEFAVLIEATDERGAEVVAASLLAALERPFDLAGRKTHIHASIGIAFARSARSPSELLANADVAMYSAKAAGDHRYSHFEPVMHAELRGRHELIRELQGAVDRDEIALVYEPIVDLRDGSIVAFEALARWHSLGRGVVPALDFVSVAEASGLMIPIGRAVLRQACQAASRWQTAHPQNRGIGVCVNLSSTELANEALTAEVAQALLETHLPAESLTFELTDPDVMWRLDAAQRRMLELRGLGVKLTLDDFGAGHSSLERLDTFPLDTFKIAKPFVDKLLDETAGPSFIDAFVRLGYSLDIACVAKGIEHASQIPRLLDRGCALGQGFYFAAPMRSDELELYLASYRRAGQPNG